MLLTSACGMMLTYYLRQMEHFHVVLIDKKPFWENTPMVIAALANPDDWASKILYPYDKMIPEGRGKFIQGGISKLNKDSVETNGGTIPFDYCVLCTGSSYKQFVKSNAMSAAFREKTLKSNHKKLLNAKSILIVGAGNLRV